MTNISQLDLLRKFNEKEANYNSEMTKIYGHRYTEYMVIGIQNIRKNIIYCMNSNKSRIFHHI